ncbi:MAG: dihydrofolate reductase family protein [Chloroflexia bacterium]
MRIILIAAVTLDGKMARHAAHLSDWTSPQDKRIFREETRRAGVVILGNNTYKTLASPLPGRLHIVLTRDPPSQPAMPGVVEFTDAPPAAIVADLERRGYMAAALTGGAQVNSLFLAADLVDEIWLTVEPLIFGRGIGIFEDAVPDLRARLVELRQLNEGAFLVRYSLR